MNPRTTELGPDVVGAPALRPQLLMLMLFGSYVLDRGLFLFSGSIIEVLARLSVSEHATRSTLTRMVNRGLLQRRRDGRRMYFGLTPSSVDLLHEGEARIWQTGPVNDDWDGTWTLLCFSLPESWQRQRHDLRTQLAWAGFGPLQGGLWIAPGHVRAESIVAGLGLGAHVRVFRARADELTDIRQLVSDAYDLDSLAVRYRDFLDRWERRDGAAAHSDPLATRLAVIAEWLSAIERDPRLPVQHLPPHWPAVRAQQLFRRLEAHLDEPARAIAATMLDTLPA